MELLPRPSTRSCHLSDRCALLPRHWRHQRRKSFGNDDFNFLFIDELSNFGLAHPTVFCFELHAAHSMFVRLPATIKPPRLGLTIGDLAERIDNG